MRRCEVSRNYSRSVKQCLGQFYARHLPADVRHVNVAIRELGDGSVWPRGGAEPRPVALILCDIRRGRRAAQRSELARQLVVACKEIVDPHDDNLNVEFMQHRGEEMYDTICGGLSRLHSGVT